MLASETEQKPDMVLLRMFNLALHCRWCVFPENYGTYRALTSTPCLASQLLRQSGQWLTAAWCSNTHSENPYSSLDYSFLPCRVQFQLLLWRTPNSWKLLHWSTIVKQTLIPAVVFAGKDVVVKLLMKFHSKVFSFLMTRICHFFDSNHPT